MWAVILELCQNQLRLRDFSIIVFVTHLVSQLAITCSKLTKEILEQDVKYVQS